MNLNETDTASIEQFHEKIKGMTEFERSETLKRMIADNDIKDLSEGNFAEYFNRPDVIKFLRDIVD